MMDNISATARVASTLAQEAREAAVAKLTATKIAHQARARQVEQEQTLKASNHREWLADQDARIAGKRPTSKFTEEPESTLGGDIRDLRHLDDDAYQQPVYTEGEFMEEEDENAQEKDVYQGY